VVSAQPPAPTPEVVLKYLARYVRRVALSESRLRRGADGQVTFTVKDDAAGGAAKELTLSAVEFLRRWTEHVLPRGFVAARHDGLLANRGRAEKLACCRRLLWPLAYVAVAVTPAAPAVAACPHCGAGLLVSAGQIAPAWRASVGPGVAVDSS